jgi:DNA-binding NtrC family response regulator
MTSVGIPDLKPALEKRLRLEEMAIPPADTDPIETASRLLEAGLPGLANDLLQGLPPRVAANSGFQSAFIWTYARSLYELGRWADLHAFVARLEDNNSDVADVAIRRSIIRTAWALLRTGESEAARQRADQCRDFVATDHALGPIADLSHFDAYWSLTRQSNALRASQQIDLAIAIYRELDEPIGMARGLILRSAIEFATGLLQSARNTAAEALDTAIRVGNLSLLQDSLREVAISEYRMGNYATALECIKKGLEVDRHAPNTRFAQALYLAKARVHIYQGNLSLARASLLNAAKHLRVSGERQYMAILKEYEGLVDMEQGKGEEAILKFDEAAKILDEIEFASYERTELILRRAEALLLLHKYPDASEEASRGLEQLNRIGEGLERGQFLRVKGVAAHYMGRPMEAAETLEKAERELRRVGDLFELGRALLDKAELLRGNQEVAVADAAEAIKLFERIGLGEFAQRARDAFLIRQMRLRRSRSEAVNPGRTAGQSFVASSPAMKSLVAEIDRIAEYDGVVLITGETGVGKEILARLVHERSQRLENAFVSVNCAAIPESLFEREIFGHARGAYTGADSDRHGLVEVADGGSMFLDEIGEMPLALQPKLLRLLQEGTYRRVGDATECTADIRFIVATNRDLGHQVAQGGFREDLFYRLKWFELHVPPLRERPEDVVDLVKFFLGRESRKRGITYWMEKSAWPLIKRHAWPGNVRELEAVICTAAARSGSSGCIGVAELPSALRGERKSRALPSLDLAKQLEWREREVILEALRKAQYHRSEAARLLGIRRNTLYDKMKRLGIKPE